MKTLALWLAILATGIVWDAAADEWVDPYTGFTSEYFAQPYEPRAQVYGGDVQGFSYGTPNFMIHDVQIGDVPIQGYTVGGDGFGFTWIDIE